ncbi:MAG: hypothetical protein K2Y37_00575 [Pirellulales bacterium]|nr:hypothetical protein [Pirellulales bacterium]
MICMTCHNPRCRRVLAVPTKLRDKICRCPACGHSFCASSAADSNERNADRLAFVSAEAKRQASEAQVGSKPAAASVAATAVLPPPTATEKRDDELQAEPVTLAELRRRSFVELGNEARRAGGTLVTDTERQRLDEYDARISHFLTCLSALSHANEDPTLPRRLRRPVLRCQLRRDGLLADIGRRAFEQGAVSVELRRRLDAIAEVERLLERRHGMAVMPHDSASHVAPSPAVAKRPPVRNRVSRFTRAMIAALI